MTERETDPERRNDLLQVTQLSSGRAGWEEISQVLALCQHSDHWAVLPLEEHTASSEYVLIMQTITNRLFTLTSTPP